MIVTLYGIPNCDSVKKARAWLAAEGIAYAFVDFKKVGAPGERLPEWVAAVGWDKLINRQGTTWRQLSPKQQLDATHPAGALALTLSQPSVIKRPVVDWQQEGGAAANVTVGFNATVWAEHLHALSKLPT